MAQTLADALGAAASSAAPQGWLAQLVYGAVYAGVEAWFDIADKRAQSTAEVADPASPGTIARGRAIAAKLPGFGPDFPVHTGS